MRLIAIALLALLCGCAFADCHHGSCHADDDCSGVCPHVCRCAIVQTSSLEPGQTTVALAIDNVVQLPQALEAGIFRPPAPNA